MDAICNVAVALIHAVEHYMREIHVDTLGVLQQVRDDGGRADAKYLDDMEAWMESHDWKSGALMHVVNSWALSAEDSLPAALLDEQIKQSVAEATRVVSERRQGVRGVAKG
jgi:hypothetical protein